MAKTFTFGKEEHLYLKKEIEGLFSSDKKMLSYPFRALYTVVEAEDVPVKLLISAPKRRLKHAVDRNRIKRLVREAYRTNKLELSALASEKNVSIHIAVIYIGNELPDYTITEKSIKYFLHKIATNLTTTTAETKE